MLIYCCADLIFATKIRATADALQACSRPARNAEMLQKRLDRVEDGKPNAPVTAVFVDLELGEDGVRLISQTKSADPDIPVIAFGPHVAVEYLDAARDAGADTVMTRGRFTADLPELVARFGGGQLS